MTNSFTSKLRQAGLVLAIASHRLGGVAPARASPSAPKRRQQCTGDAFKLCSSEIPNIPAITACMFKHKAELSSGCRSVMDKELAAKSRKVATND